MFSIQTIISIARALITKKSPYYIQFYINGRCNFVCRQCNIVETNSRVREMSLDEIRLVARNIREIGGGIVLLTGGEPFLRTDLAEIVEIFVREKLNVRLQTAGSDLATTERLRDCYEAGARDINVSLDSLETLKSDYINGVPGSGAMAIAAIERISNVFRSDSCILSFGCVMSRYNYREIPAILHFAKRIGWKVSLVPVHIAKVGTRRGFRSFDETFIPSQNNYMEFDKVIEEAILLKRAGYPLFDSERFLRSSSSFLKGKGPTWRKNGRCDSPNLYFAIRPNGDFTTCCDYTLANPPGVQSNEFVSQYKSGILEKRADVEKIVSTCEGCHYGSYPEVSLSVRDFPAFLERVRLVLSWKRTALTTTPVQKNFKDEVLSIQSKFSDVYPTSQWLDPPLAEALSLWQVRQTRMNVMKNDWKIRQEQGRIRGHGEDTPIEPEIII